jgi:hemolysin activation/secretion protein
VRSRDVNLYGQLQYDNVKLRDHIDASNIKTDRHLDNLTLSLSGDARDGLLSGGMNTWNVGVTTGRVNLDDADATASTQGHFAKLTTTLARQQGLSINSSVYVAFTGQWANKNLDPSQKMSVGGPYSVRAYNIGALSGDVGYFVTGEYRYGLGQAWDGQWLATAFVDSAGITVSKNIVGTGENSAALSGAGLGLSWTGPDQWSARAYIAKPIGSVPVLLNTPKSSRVWIETRKGF